MERFGKSRRLRMDEFVDQVGYIRRFRQEHKSEPSVLSILFLVLVLGIVGFIVNYWKIIFAVLGGVIVLIGLILLFVHLTKRQKEKRRQVLIWR